LHQSSDFIALNNSHFRHLFWLTIICASWYCFMVDKLQTFRSLKMSVQMIELEAVETIQVSDEVLEATVTTVGGLFNSIQAIVAPC